MKVQVVCSGCEKTRYAKPPIPSPYVCQRCRTAEKNLPTAADSKPATPKGDPFYSDLARRAEINARAQKKAPAWIPKRKGWLR